MDFRCFNLADRALKDGNIEPQPVKESNLSREFDGRFEQKSKILRPSRVLRQGEAHFDLETHTSSPNWSHGFQNASG
jgi:hypothetical protein